MPEALRKLLFEMETERAVCSAATRQVLYERYADPDAHPDQTAFPLTAASAGRAHDQLCTSQCHNLAPSPWLASVANVQANWHPPEPRMKQDKTTGYIGPFKILNVYAPNKIYRVEIPLGAGDSVACVAKIVPLARYTAKAAPPSLGDGLRGYVVSQMMEHTSAVTGHRHLWLPAAMMEVLGLASAMPEAFLGHFYLQHESPAVPYAILILMQAYRNTLQRLLAVTMDSVSATLPKPMPSSNELARVASGYPMEILAVLAQLFLVLVPQLRERNVCHMDLKADNVMYMSTPAKWLLITDPARQLTLQVPTHGRLFAAVDWSWSCVYGPSPALRSSLPHYSLDPHKIWASADDPWTNQTQLAISLRRALRSLYTTELMAQTDWEYAMELLSMLTRPFDTKRMTGPDGPEWYKVFYGDASNARIKGRDVDSFEFFARFFTLCAEPADQNASILFEYPRLLH